jgi:hypothetical protein
MVSESQNEAIFPCSYTTAIIMQMDAVSRVPQR